MQESTPPPPPSSNRDLGIIWRLAQVCLALAASYLYFQFASFGAAFHDRRLMGSPHTLEMLKTVLIGLGIGLCIGLATKDFSKGRIAWHLDWPTLLINVIAAGVFCAVSIFSAIAVAANRDIIYGPLRDTTWLSPLLPFVWLGLSLTTVVRSRQP